MWTKLVDLAREPKNYPLYDMPESPGVSKSHYPWGLCITLEKEDLDKLGLDCNCDVGDMIDMRCFAEVVSVSKEGDGATVRLQIQKIALENEMDEEAPGAAKA